MILGFCKFKLTVLHTARNSELVLGGSIGMAITHKKPFKLPGDIDLFTNDNGKAMDFCMEAIYFLATQKVYYKVLFNNSTTRLLNDVSNHIRIQVPFWKPICVMTVKTPLRKFYWNGIAVQYYDDITKAAKHATTIDSKPRILSDLDDVLEQSTGSINRNIYLPPSYEKDADIDQSVENYWS